MSADMSQQFRQEIEALPAESWQIWKVENGGMIREWAEVPMCQLVTKSVFSSKIHGLREQSHILTTLGQNDSLKPSESSSA